MNDETKCPDCGMNVMVESGQMYVCDQDATVQGELHVPGNRDCFRRQFFAQARELEQAEAACAAMHIELDTRWSFISTQARDLNAMSDAGGKLAVAAARVLNTYDGVHRLADALSGWMRVVADEGGRGTSPGQPIIDEIARLRRLEAAVEDDGLKTDIILRYLAAGPCAGQALVEYRAALREAAGKEGER